MLNLLCALSAAGQEIHVADANDESSARLAIVQRLSVNAKHITDAHKLVESESDELWTQLQAQKIVLADVARAFSAIMATAPEGQALQAAAVYSSLLLTPGCPVRFSILRSYWHLVFYQEYAFKHPNILPFQRCALRSNFTLSFISYSGAKLVRSRHLRCFLEVNSRYRWETPLKG